jgi:hypothetical protein
MRQRDASAALVSLSAAVDDTWAGIGQAVRGSAGWDKPRSSRDIHYWRGMNSDSGPIPRRALGVPNGWPGAVRGVPASS